MKKCIKCNSEHNKPGTHCSRSCANSRIQNLESNEKRKLAMTGLKQSKESIKILVETFKRRKLDKYLVSVLSQDDIFPTRTW